MTAVKHKAGGGMRMRVERENRGGYCAERHPVECSGDHHGRGGLLEESARGGDAPQTIIGWKPMPHSWHGLPAHGCPMGVPAHGPLPLKA